MEKGQFALGSGKNIVNRTILVTEPVARALSQTYATPELVVQDVAAKARRPLDERTFARYWANPGSSSDTQDRMIGQMRHYLGRTERAQAAPTPPWLEWTGYERIETVPVMSQAQTALVVTGDCARNKVLTVPGGSNVTVRIELPVNWDALLKPLGYRPLSDFTVSETNQLRQAQMAGLQRREQMDRQLRQAQARRPGLSADKYRPRPRKGAEQSPGRMYPREPAL